MLTLDTKFRDVLKLSRHPVVMGHHHTGDDDQSWLAAGLHYCPYIPVTTLLEEPADTRLSNGIRGAVGNTGISGCGLTLSSATITANTFTAGITTKMTLSDDMVELIRNTARAYMEEMLPYMNEMGNI